MSTDSIYMGSQGDTGPQGPAGPNGSIDILTDVDTTTVTPSSGDRLEFDGSNWVPVPHRQIMMLWAEENGSMADNTDEWSYGNGAVGAQIGIPMLYPGRILGMSINAETAPTSSCNVEVRKNNTSVSNSVTLAASNNNATTTFGTPPTFIAGDVLNFKTVLGGGASDVRVCMWVEVDL